MSDFTLYVDGVTAACQNGDRRMNEQHDIGGLYLHTEIVNSRGRACLRKYVHFLWEFEL